MVGGPLHVNPSASSNRNVVSRNPLTKTLFWGVKPASSIFFCLVFFHKNQSQKKRPVYTTMVTSRWTCVFSKDKQTVIRAPWAQVYSIMCFQMWISHHMAFIQRLVLLPCWPASNKWVSWNTTRWKSYLVCGCDMVLFDIAPATANGWLEYFLVSFWGV